MSKQVKPSISIKGVSNPFGKSKAYYDLGMEKGKEGIPYIFYHTRFYREVLGLDYFFIVGPKGSGKSAIKFGILNELSSDYGILSLDFETESDIELTTTQKAFQQAKLKVLSALVLLCRNKSKDKKYKSKIDKYFKDTKLDTFLEYAKGIAKGLSISIKFLSYDLSKVIKDVELVLVEKKLLKLIKDNPNKSNLLIILDELEEIASIFGELESINHYQNLIFALYRVKMDIGDNCHILFFLKDGWFRRITEYLSAQEMLEYYRIKEIYLTQEELQKIITRRAVELLRRLGKYTKNNKNALLLVFGEEYKKTLEYISNQVVSGPRDVIILCNAVASEKKKIPLLKKYFTAEIGDFYKNWWNTWENEYRESLPNLRDIITIFLNYLSKIYNGKIPNTITWNKLKKAIENTMMDDEVVQKYKASWFYGRGKSYIVANLFANLGIIGVKQPSGEYHFKWNGIVFEKIFDSDRLKQDYEFSIHHAFLTATGN